MARRVLKSDDYESRLLESFRQLSSRAHESKTPRFETYVAAKALELQRKSEEDEIALDLDPRYYVYVLMDPRKPGPWTYKVKDKTLVLPFEPFYVGKGKGRRVRHHAKAATKDADPKQGEGKLNKIRKLHRLGLKPIERKLCQPSLEAVAFIKEVLLIRSIGREDLGKGPLTNLNDGGYQGAAVSPTARKKISRKALARWSKMTPSQRKAISNKSTHGVKLYWDSLSDEERKAHGAKSRAKNIKAWAAKSDEDMEAWAEQSRNITQSYWDSKSQRAKKKRTEGFRAGGDKWRASMTPKERQEWIARQKEGKLKNSLQCPWCPKFNNDKAMMHRCHFDNCKHYGQGKGNWPHPYEDPEGWQNRKDKWDARENKWKLGCPRCGYKQKTRRDLVEKHIASCRA